MRGAAATAGTGGAAGEDARAAGPVLSGVLEPLQRSGLGSIRSVLHGECGLGIGGGESAVVYGPGGHHRAAANSKPQGFRIAAARCAWCSSTASTSPASRSTRARRHRSAAAGPDGKSMPATKKPIGLLIAHTAELNPTGSHVVRDAAYFEEATLAGAARGEQSQGTAGREAIGREPGHRDRPQRRDRTDEPGCRADDVRDNQQARPRDYQQGAARRLQARGSRSANGHGQEGRACEHQGNAGSASRTSRSRRRRCGRGDYVAVAGTFAGHEHRHLCRRWACGRPARRYPCGFSNVLRFDKGQIKEDWLFYNARRLRRNSAAK